MADLAWRSSRYGEVYEALVLSLEPSVRNVRAGTEGMIGRAIFHFRAVGEEDAVAKLELIAVAIAHLQQSLRSRSEDQYLIRKNQLTRLAREWLSAAPMFPQSVTFASAIAA